MKNIKKLMVMVLAMAMAASMAACGSKQEAAPAPAPAQTEAAGEAEAPAEMKKFDVVLDWYPNAVHTFLYEAIDKGYFAEEGLEVNLISPAESVDATTFVATGKAQIGLSYPIDTIMASVNEGMPVQAIGAISQEALGCMASLASHDVTADMASLAGKKIGYSGTASAKAEIETITQNAGLNEGDYELINVGFDLTTSLTTESADLVVGTFINDEIVTMRNAGYDVNVWKYQDYGVPAMYGLIMIANDDALAADPEAYAGFLRACNKGFADMIADEDAALEVIMTEMNSDDNPLDDVQQRESYRTLLPLMQTADAPFLTMTVDRWQPVIDWMLESELISENCDAAEVFTAPELN